MVADENHLYWDKYYKLYATNREFHDYVERLRRPGKNDAGCSLSEILARKTVKDVGDYFEKKPDSEVTPISPVSPNDFCSCEDKSC